MEFDQVKRESRGDLDGSVGIREVVESYLIHLKWFVLSVFLFGILGFLKTRYEVPRYKINSSILIKEQERGNSISDMSEFQDLGLFIDGGSSLKNEIEIIKSRKLIRKTVEELKLNVRYSIENTPYDIEQFPNFSLILNFESDSSSIDNISTNFAINIISNDIFEFIGFNEKSYGRKSFGEYFTVDVGNENFSDKRLINIKINDDFNHDIRGKKIKVNIDPVDKVVSRYMERLVIEPIDEIRSNVLNISIEEPVIEKGIAFINNLIEQYNADGINDKNIVAQATTDFLDDRLILISAELKAIEATALQYKTRMGMLDVDSDAANMYLESSSLTESDLVGANTDLILIDYMLDELNNSNLTDPIPGNIGLSEPSIENRVNEYNNLVLQRNRVINSSTVRNPQIINIDSQLRILKSSLKLSLNTLRSSAQIQIDALNRKSGQISSKIASVPKQEKEFNEIVRQQETKNVLFLFLLQKREESIISNAVSIDKSKIIDAAYSNETQVSPNKLMNYLGSVILGLLIPFIIIYIKNLLDTKVHDERDIVRLKIPYLGDVPLALSKKNLYLNHGDNSNIAEAFRYVRTSINFMLDNKEKGKTVFITSTQKGEGKTFTAINLALSLANSGKKTLLLAMDLRNPKIFKYLDIKNKIGVSNFIKNHELTFNEIKGNYPKFSNLDIIDSGDIPPNPVELLMSNRVQELFDIATESYKYVIVDTAPVGMVTDTIQISKFADLTIYVIRSNSLDRRMLNIPEKLHNENKLKNMSILINGTDHSKGAYGYGYEYGYGKKVEKPWYKKMFGFLNYK